MVFVVLDTGIFKMLQSFLNHNHQQDTLFNLQMPEQVKISLFS